MAFLCFLLGFSWGFMFCFFAPTLWVIWHGNTSTQRPTRTEKTRDEIIDSWVEKRKEEKKQGDFIKVNKVEEIIKSREGEIKLGDVLEDDNE